MLKRGAHSRRPCCLLVLTVLAIPSAAMWGRAPQDASPQQVGPELPGCSFLPGMPFWPALCADETQPMVESTESQAVGSALEGRSKSSETGSASALAASQPAPDPRSQAVGPEGRPLAQGDQGPQATNPPSPLMLPSTAVGQRVSQAITARMAELAFPGLLPRTPLSPALWTADTRPVGGETEDQTASSARGGGSKPFEVVSVSAFAASPSAVVLPSHALEPGDPSPDQGYEEPQTTDQGPPLTIPSTAVWKKVSQAITILHVEPALPTLLPRSPASPDLWADEPVVQWAKESKKNRKERGRSAAFQPPPVLVAAGMVPDDQPPAPSQNESLITGNGQTLAASQRAPALQPGETSATAPSQAGKSTSPEMVTARTSDKTTQGENGKREKGETPASQTPLAPPSSVASQKNQPIVEDYHGPHATDHSSTVALHASASEFPSTPGGRQALRDPFKLPPPPRPEQEEKDDPKWPGNRPPGSRGLLVEQLRLKGIVRDGASQKMIAVVTTNNNRAYFLREGEAVYDGVVNKITSDAVYFKGNISDAKREVRSREVVKTLSPAPGEAR